MAGVELSIEAKHAREARARAILMMMSVTNTDTTSATLLVDLLIQASK